MTRQNAALSLFETCLAGYGVWAATGHPNRNMIPVPDGLEYPTYVMFVVAAVLMCVGRLRDRLGPALLGRGIAVIATLTVAGATLFGDHNAGMFLLAGTAALMMSSRARLKRENSTLHTIAGRRGASSGEDP